MQNAPVSEAVLMQELREFCARYRTARLAAKALGITSSVLSLTLNGKANVIPARVLKKLKYKMAPTYVKTGKAGKAAALPAPAAAKAVAEKINDDAAASPFDGTFEPPFDDEPVLAVNVISITDGH